MGVRTKAHRRALALAAGLAAGSILVAPGAQFAGAQVAATDPPTIAASLSPATIGPGSTSTLTLTITNATETAPVTDLAVSSTLPAGVTLASASNASSTCLDATVTGANGGSSFAMTGGGVAAGGSCSVSVDVTASASGTITTSPLSSSAGESANTAIGLTVATDRPGFSKSFSPSTVPFGGSSTLTFTIDNTANASQATNIVFVDTLPPGVVVAGPANVSNTCIDAPFNGGIVTAAPGTNTISLAGQFGTNAAAVAAGSTCTISVAVTATAVGTHVNSTGVATSILGSQTRDSGKANAILTVTPASTSLEMTKSFTNDPVAPGALADLQFTVRNLDRRFTATDLSFTDDLDATLSGLTAVSLPSNPCGSGSQMTGTSVVSLTGGQLGPGGTCTFSVTVLVPSAAAPGSYPNKTTAIAGTIDGSTVLGGTATDTLFVVAAPILTKEFLDAPTGGDNVTSAGSDVLIRFTITDTTTAGGSTNIAFTDELTTFVPFPITATLPGTGFCGASSQMFIIGLGTGRQGIAVLGASLDAGTSCTFDVGVHIPLDVSTGTYVNTTDPITATVGGVAVTGNSATADLDVVAAPSLRKEFTNDPIAPGDAVTLKFSIANGGFEDESDIDAMGDATNVAFNDDLTAGAFVAGITAVDLPADGFCGAGSQLSEAGGILSLTNATVLENTICTFSVTLQSNALTTPQGVHTNTTSNITATVLGEEVSAIGATDDLVVSDLRLTKEFTDDPVAPGGTVNLRFVVTNSSSTTAVSEIFFQDDLDDVVDGLAVTSVSPVSDPCGLGSTLHLASGGTFISLFDGLLAPNESCTIDLALSVPANAEADSYSNLTTNFRATIDGANVPLPNAGDILQVGAAPSITLTKKFTNNPRLAGSTATLQFTIQNPSLEPISSIAFTDVVNATLPGLARVGTAPSNPCGAGSTLTGTTVLTLAGGSLAAGAQCVFTVSLGVPAGATPGTYLNTTSAPTGTASSGAATGAPATSSLVVVSPTERIADLSITKVDDITTSATAGGTVIYTVTVNNAGPNPAPSVVVSDTLPAGATLVKTIGCNEDPNGTPSCTLGGINTGASKSFTIEAVIAPSFLGSLTNVASVTSAATDPDPDNNTVSETTTVAAVADLSVDVTDSPDPVIAGEQVTYTATITNNGPSDATNVVLRNTPPGGSMLPVAFGTIAAGDSASYSITVNVDPSALGTISDTATVESDAADPDTSNNSDTENTTVEAEADLSITKTGSIDPATAGADTVTYTIKVNNAGPSNATNVVVTDTLPAGVTFVSTSGCTEDDNGVPTCTLGTIAAGSFAQYDVTVSVDASTLGTITNRASVSSDTTDPDTDNNSASEDTEVVAEADLSIDKVDDLDPATPGDTVNYTITVSNAGPSDATNVVVFDDLPIGLTFVSTSGCDEDEDDDGVPTCTLGTIAADGSAQYTVEVTVDDGPTQVVTNSVTVDSDTLDPDTENNTATEDTQINGDADLSIEKSDALDPAFAGFFNTYTITVTNNGPGIAENVVVTDTLPAGVTLVSTSGCDEDPSGVPTCSLGDLADDETASFTVDVAIDSATLGTVTNTASVDSDTPDPDTENNTASEDTEIIQGADLSITKIDKDDPVESGKKIKYTITVFNAGPLAATNVQVTDVLPAGVTFTKTKHCDNGNSAYPTCDLGTIAAGASEDYEIEVEVDGPTRGTITNTATVTSSTPDPDLANNTASESTLVCGDKDGKLGFVDCGSVTEDADLSIAITNKKDPVVAGKKIEYTITVTNAGPGPAVGVIVTASLPAGVTFDKTDHCVEKDGYPTCTLGLIEAGESADYKLTAKADSGTTGTVTTTASVTSLAPDPVSTNNDATEDTLITGGNSGGGSSLASPISPSAPAAPVAPSPSADNPIQPTGGLPVTGGNGTNSLLATGLATLLLGLVFLGSTRRRRTA